MEEVAAWNLHLAELVSWAGSVRLVNCLLRATEDGSLPASTVNEFVRLGSEAEHRFLRLPNMGKKSFFELRELVSQFCDQHGLDIHLPPEKMPVISGGESGDALLKGQSDSVLLKDFVPYFTQNARLKRVFSGDPAAEAVSQMTITRWQALSHSERVAVFFRIPTLGSKAFVALGHAIDAFQRNQESIGASQASVRSEASSPLPSTSIDYIAAFQQALGMLTARELEIIRARLEENLTLEEVGARLGVTRERIRQIEKKGLNRFAQIFTTLIENSELKSLMGDIWLQLSASPVYFKKTSFNSIHRKLKFYHLLPAVAVYGSVQKLLDHFCVDLGQVWVYGVEKEQIDKAEIILRKALIGLEVPVVFARLVSDARVDTELAECILANDDSYVLYRNIIVEKPLTIRKRRLVSVLHLLVYNYQSGPVRLMDLYDQYITQHPGDPCTPRDIFMVLKQYPRIFQRAGTFGWINLSPAVPLAGTAEKEEEFVKLIEPDNNDEPGSLTEPAATTLISLILEVLRDGPLPYRNIAEQVRIRSSGRYPSSSVFAMLATYPEFDFFAPGLLGLYRSRRCPDYIAAGQRHLLTSSLLRQYVLAQLAGAPRLEYPCWDVNYFRSVAEWLYDEGELADLGSLIDHLELGGLDLTSTELVRYRNLARLTPARIETPDAPDLALESIGIKHVVRAAWVALHCKAFNWMAANRVSGERLDSYRRGPTLVRVLIALGIIQPSAVWFESHQLGKNASNVLLELLVSSQDSFEEPGHFWRYVDQQFRHFCEGSPWSAASQHEFAAAIDMKIAGSLGVRESHLPPEQSKVTLENTDLDAEILDEFLYDHTL